MRTRTSSRREVTGRRTVLTAALVVAGLLLTVGCSSDSSSEASSSGGTQKITLLTTQGGLGDWEAYVAKAKGYFAEEHLDVEIRTFATGGEIATALISGRGNVATNSLPTAITAATQNAPIKIVAATQLASPQGKYNNWWAVLPDSPVRSAADLAGKKIDIYSQNSLAQATTRTVMSDAGVDVGRFSEVAVPFPQSYSALTSGQVDAALFIEPFFSNANKQSMQKYGKPLRVVYTYLDVFKDGLNLSGLLANTNWAGKNGDALRAYVRATLKAAKWGNANPDELKKIIAQGAGVEYSTISDMVPAEMSEDGKLYPDMLQRMQQMMITFKMAPGLTSPMPDSKIVDYSYLSSN